MSKRQNVQILPSTQYLPLPGYVCPKCMGDTTRNLCNCNNIESYTGLRNKTKKTPDYDRVLDSGTNYKKLR